MSPALLRRIVQSRSYADLVRLFPPRPIRDAKALDRTCQVVESLMGVERASRDQFEFLDLLSTLVERYEEAEFPPAAVALKDLLSHLIEAKGVSKAEVARSAKVSASTISDVLAGRRSLSRENIKRLSKYFGVSPSAFLDAKGPKGKEAA